MTDSKRLPPAEKTQLTVGFMRLTDSAPLIMARELGYFEALGLEVKLVREVSWANLRDRLVMGDLDAAQMLAPLPMMTAYGAGGLRANLLTGLSLSLNGNAITLAGQLWQRLGMPLNREAAAADSVCRLRAHLDNVSRKPGLTLATVHLFSMHTLLLRMWLTAGGIDPDRDVRIIVLPPEQMCDSLARGVIDGFCVGEPWNSLAVMQGTGFIAATGYQVWNNAPEKVLAVTENWHKLNNASHLRLRIAVMKAQQYLADSGRAEAIAEILSQPSYLNLPVKVMLPSLSGQLRFYKTEPPVAVPDFHVFWRYQAGFPWRSDARALVNLSSYALASPVAPEQVSALVQQCYRPNLYREAARHLSLPAPGKDSRPLNRHDSLWTFENGIELGADRQMVVP